MPAPSAFLFAELPAHSADCTCFALENRAYTDSGLAPLAEPRSASPMEVFVSRVAGTPGASGRILCQPTPGWKQSPGIAPGVAPVAGELPLFPNLPVLRRAPCLVGGLLCAVCGLASGAAARNINSPTRVRVVSSIIQPNRKLSL